MQKMDDIAELLHSEYSYFLPLLPYWVQALLPVVLLCGALYFGYSFGRRKLDRSAAAESAEYADVGLVLSAALGLLSLLFAFTFGFIINWENVRKSTATEQVVTIGTAFNTASLLDDPAKTQLKSAILEFALTRDLDRPTSLPPEELLAQLIAGRDARIELWPTAIEAISGDVPAPVRVAVSSSVNDALDAWERLRKSMTEEINLVAKLTLLGMGIGTMFLTGFCAAKNETKLIWAWVSVPILLGIVAALITDVEHPKHGLIRIEVSALDALLLEMEADLKGTTN